MVERAMRRLHPWVAMMGMRVSYALVSGSVEGWPNAGPRAERTASLFAA